MREPRFRSMLLPRVPEPSSDDPSRVPRPRRSRRRHAVTGTLVLTLSLFVASPGEAGFKALLQQLVVYVGILVDEWEKHSRILEDHFEQATGVMQPFSDIHAGVTELVQTTPDLFHSTVRLVDNYKSGLTDPDCYRYPPTCTFQQDFIPPELSDVLYTARYGIPNGAQYTLADLEAFVYGQGGYDPGDLADALDNVGWAGAADLRDKITRQKSLTDRLRWSSRRMRSAVGRGSTYVDEYLTTGPRDANGCPTSPTPNLIDQAAGADCLSGAANIDSPLSAPQAHLSPAEAATIKATSMMSVVEMAAVELETLAHQEETALAAEEAAEQARRQALADANQRLDCFESHGTVAYGEDASCGNVRDRDDFLDYQNGLLLDSF